MMRIVLFFESVHRLERAARRAEDAGWRTVGACSPAFNETVLRAAHATRSPVAIVALLGGIAGLLSGVLLTVGTVREWPGLIVGGKPLVSVPPFLIIIFELTILLAGLAAAYAFLVGSRRARRSAARAWDPSTTDDRFSLLLEPRDASADPPEHLVRQLEPDEWRPQNDVARRL